MISNVIGTLFNQLVACDSRKTPNVRRSPAAASLPCGRRVQRLVGQLAELETLSWITAAQCYGDDPFDGICLRTSVGFTELAIRRRVSHNQVSFEVFVFTSRGGMVAEIVT